MGNTLQEFLVSLGFTIDQNSLSNFVGGLESASVRIIAFGTTMAAVAGAVVASIHSIAEENKALGLLAQELGATTGAVDDFIDTADMLGISNETATDSLKHFAKNVADAGMGVGRAKLIFEKLDISVKNANGTMRSSTDVMADLQEKMQGMGRAQQLSVMERLGLDPKLLVMFNDAFGNTKHIGEELSKIDIATGFNLDTAIEESNKFSKSWKNTQVEVNLIKMLFSKMYETIAIHIMPKVRESVESFGKTVESARRLIMDNAQAIEGVLEPIINVILRIGTAFTILVGRAFAIIGAVLKPVFDMLVTVNKATDGWAGYIAAALVAWKMFNLGFLATPIGAIFALGVALLALYDDFETWKEGGISFINWGGTAGKVIFAVIGAIGTFATTLGVVKGVLLASTAIQTAYTAAVGIYTAVTTTATGATGIFGTALTVLRTAFGILSAVMMANPVMLIAGLFAVAAGLIIYNWDTVKEWFQSFMAWLNSYINFDEVGANITAFSTMVIDGFQNIFDIVRMAWDYITSFKIPTFDLKNMFKIPTLDFNNLFNGIDNVISSVTEKFNNFFTTLTGLFNGSIAPIDAFNATVGTIESVLSGIFNKVGELIVAFGNLFGIDLSGFVGAFSSAFDFITGLITGVMTAIMDVIGAVGKAASAISSITGIGDTLGKIGDVAINAVMGKSTPAVAQGQAGATNTNTANNNATNNVHQNTVINVNGSTDPKATAQAVQAQQSTVNAQVIRNMSPKVR